MVLSSLANWIFFFFCRKLWLRTNEPDRPSSIRSRQVRAKLNIWVSFPFQTTNYSHCVDNEYIDENIHNKLNTVRTSENQPDSHHRQTFSRIDRLTKLAPLQSAFGFVKLNIVLQLSYLVTNSSNCLQQPWNPWPRLISQQLFAVPSRRRQKGDSDVILEPDCNIFYAAKPDAKGPASPYPAKRKGHRRQIVSTWLAEMHDVIRALILQTCREESRRQEPIRAFCRPRRWWIAWLETCGRRGRKRRGKFGPSELKEIPRYICMVVGRLRLSRETHIFIKYPSILLYFWNSCCHISPALLCSALRKTRKTLQNLSLFDHS